MSQVWGKVLANSKLSGRFFHCLAVSAAELNSAEFILGTPDLSLSFSNPQSLTDCAFHPCVR